MSQHCVSPALSLLKILYSNAYSHINSLHCISLSRWLTQTRLISCSLTCRVRGENEKLPKKKTQRVPEITLYHPDKSMTITTLSVAEKIAKRRNLLLTKLKDADSKTNRETYMLASPANHVLQKEDPVKQEKHKDAKPVKFITIHTKIQSSDLAVKCRHITRLVEKNHTVKIGILPSSDQSEVVMNKVANTIIKHLTDKAECVRTARKTHCVIMAHPLKVNNSK